MKFTRKDYTKRIVDKANKIPEDEPVFLLRGQDKLAPDTLRRYCELLEEEATKQEGVKRDGLLSMADELRVHAREMVVWQHTKREKLPDK